MLITKLKKDLHFASPFYFIPALITRKSLALRPQMRLSLIILFSIYTYFGSCQQLKKEKLRFTTGIGTAFYNGDLCSSPDCWTYRHHLSLGARYYIGPGLSWRAEAHHFRLRSEDSNPIRNLSFRSDNWMVSFVMQYEILPTFKNEQEINTLSPYVFGGIGLLTFNPQAKHIGEWKDLQPLQTEGVSYSTFGMVIPLGAGFRVNLPNNFHLALEFTFSKTFSDYLDDVSGSYIDNSELPETAGDLADRTFEGGNTPTITSDGEHWSEGAERGSKEGNDHYMFLDLRLNIPLIMHKTVCPSDFWN